MNKYTPDNNYIIDASGKEWPVEEWHAMPLPSGIRDDSHIFFAKEGNPQPFCHYSSPHWLARRPLPPVPKQKTQEEIDVEACQGQWLNFNKGRPSVPHCNSTFADGFFAGIEHARKETK